MQFAGEKKTCLSMFSLYLWHKKPIIVLNGCLKLLFMKKYNIAGLIMSYKYKKFVPKELRDKPPRMKKKCLQKLRKKINFMSNYSVFDWQNIISTYVKKMSVNSNYFLELSTASHSNLIIMGNLWYHNNKFFTSWNEMVTKLIIIRHTRTNVLLNSSLFPYGDKHKRKK